MSLKSYDKLILSPFFMSHTVRARQVTCQELSVLQLYILPHFLVDVPSPDEALGCASGPVS